MAMREKFEGLPEPRAWMVSSLDMSTLSDSTMSSLSNTNGHRQEKSKTLYMSLELGSHCQVVLQLYYGENHSAKTSHLPPTSLRFPEIPLLTSLYRSSGRLRSFEATEGQHYP
ncbi:hypothetical protein KCU72_g36, partial [Aureobasidium melanogenum]